jgi:hypothetical protein
MEHTRPKQLLVFGNGFDLACGLSSSFTDWMNSRWRSRYFLNVLKCFIDRNDGLHEAEFNTLMEEEFQTNNARGTNPQTLTAWDILLYIDKANKKTLWRNVEEFLFSTLTKSEAVGDVFNLNPEAREAVFLLINTDNKLSSLNQSTVHPVHTLLSLRYKDEYLCKIFECGKYQDSSKFRLKSEDKDETLILELLLKELKVFEGEFAAYLKKKVRLTKNYEQQAQALLSTISDNEAASELAVMTFNYTEPFGDIQAVFNVHGTLRENNIIFGIDKDNSKKAPVEFTKTFRKLFNKPTAVLAEYNSIEAVKFFGHSLGEMDYSYFRSVFDSVDLYKAKVRLVFYYSIYNKKRAEEIRRSQFLLVTKLIDDYQALDGQRGRNLMHKLMLEGRLSIEKISTEEIFELHSR